MRKILVGLVVVGLAFTLGACSQTKKPKAAAAAKAELQRIHFDYDKSDIKSESRGTLEGNANWLKKNKGSDVVIEGHCDERGSDEYNIALGHRRANSAKNYLVSLGVEAKRMTSKSYGEEKPLEKCSNESCWSKNRRAEFNRK
ncbi:MAG: peptidoglycan-associated lipoprotein Pal [Deltaproteobacteria bacterium]|nr:peptidoglycan-associated lipoprotein Pal [Deltaproteobacteria bacterium]